MVNFDEIKNILEKAETILQSAMRGVADNFHYEACSNVKNMQLDLLHLARRKFLVQA
jgi:hypothetical protein